MRRTFSISCHVAHATTTFAQMYVVVDCFSFHCWLIVAGNPAVVLEQKLEQPFVVPFLMPTECSSLLQCVQDFLSAENDGFQEASDGSRQVKIHVCCPQCRSKYPMDIHELLLLRKVRVKKHCYSLRA